MSQHSSIQRKKMTRYLADPERLEAEWGLPEAARAENTSHPEAVSHALTDPSPGQTLAPETQVELESRLGHTLADVRIHTDEEAHSLSEALGAVAFTTGQDIFFGRGAYDPDSAEGMHLLAHEAAHTVQQRSGPVGGTPLGGGVTLSDPADPFEQAAERAADGEPEALGVAPIGGGPSATAMQVQRAPLSIPAPNFGDAWFGNQSAVTFDPWAVYVINGRTVAFAGFSAGASDVLDIRAGTQGVVRMNMYIGVREDNYLLDDVWGQSCHVEWNVAATTDGHLTIDANGARTIEGKVGDTGTTSLQALEAASGQDYVRMTPTIASAGGSSSTSHGLSGGVTEGGANVGENYGWSSTTNIPGSAVSQTFTVRLRVPDVQPHVTRGPLKRLDTHEVLFERPDQNHLSSAQFSSLMAWYQNVLTRTTRDHVQAGAEPVTLEGHASTTGDPQHNLTLSNQRMEAVHQALAQFAGNRAVFETRSAGALEAQTGPGVESQQERKVIVSVWNTISEGERDFDTSAGQGAGSAQGSGSP